MRLSPDLSIAAGKPYESSGIHSKVVFEILRDLSQSKDITVILATHDLAAKEVADELIEL